MDGPELLSSSVNSQPPKKAAFVHKLYAMLSDPSLSSLIWWCAAEGVFALRPCTEFASALTSYFKHGNVSSFVRQLHMYGFHKVFDEESPRGDEVVWEFKHSTVLFRKGDEAGLAKIKRRSSNKAASEEEMRWPAPQSVYYVGYPYQPPAYGQPYASRPGTPVYVPQQQQQQHAAQHHGRSHMVHHHAPPQHQAYLARQSQTPPLYDHLHHRATSLTTTQEGAEMLKDVASQQRALSWQSEVLASEVRSTGADVLRIGESLPKLVQAIQGQGHLYKDSLNSLQQKFTVRAEQWVDHAPPPAVSFWESNGGSQRQRSVFLDPLAGPPPTPARPESLPVIYAPQPGAPSLRNESVPTRLPLQGPPPPPPPQGPPQMRSIPNGSIPNIAHLQAQLRPSLAELHAVNPHVQSSMSSNSTHATLYSSQSSISSISSRNSQTSLQLHPHIQHAHPFYPLSPTDYRQHSVSTSTDRSSKLTVSSLLESPKSKRSSNGDDGSEIDSKDRVTKRSRTLTEMKD